MIFDIWVDLPVWGIFGSLALLFATTALLIHRLCFSELTRARSSGFVGVVAPFFGSVAVLFSLLTGFLANEVWDRNRQAGRAILAERDGLLAIHAISLATVSDMKEIRAAAQGYAKALIEDEWPRMTEQESSPKAGQELMGLLTRVSNPQVGIDAGQAAQSALLDSVLKLRSTRYDRLALSGDRSDRTKWAAVVILGLITQIAIAIVHLEKPKAQAAALTIFSAAAVITLGLIAIRERPFDGPLRFSPDPVREALQVMAGAPGP
ncbi:DUF4239 domain-containing protein [Microvirga subterranea]|uniref:Uncharacterized protein DUF4239 n=1 Tax=Microvirga subterranea TaxID=186651 RepID=A0A370HTE9_9HYPH|nr:DUF4239 domain-containing protein [Microvirga subterranea]RDI61802.1 uncharacterized protein DUF4239 [Microvirga subterranea]